MVKLINEDHSFSSEMFTGGATKADVIHMHKETNEKNVKGKQWNATVTSKDDALGGGHVDRFSLSDTNVQQIAHLVSLKVKEDIGALLEKDNNTAENIEELKTTITFLEMA